MHRISKAVCASSLYLVSAAPSPIRVLGTIDVVARDNSDLVPFNIDKQRSDFEVANLLWAQIASPPPSTASASGV
jgi:hypothetical protein